MNITNKQYKDEYDKQTAAGANKVNFNSKKRKYAQIKPKEGFVSRAVREFYPDFKKLANDDATFSKANSMEGALFE